MAHARCIRCGQIYYWRARRGYRLADLRCPCGGELEGMTAGRASPAAGKHYATCSLCGGRRLQSRLITTTREWTGWNGKPIPAGSQVCAWHEVRVPAVGYPGGWSFSSVHRVEAEQSKVAEVST